MTIELWLSKAIKKLESTSVPTARLDAEVLLADITNKDRTWIHAHPEHILPEEDLCILDEQIERRMTHEPLAYIRGRQEFYGRDFAVSPDTLTPRPETETMLELLFQQMGDGRLEIGDKLQIIDVGTGSGCIIISVALELAQISNIKYQISYTGLDISESALKIAKKNAKTMDAAIKFHHFDLLNDDLTSVFNPQSSVCILANLPYVPNEFQINLAATHEPSFAIYGGVDGLDYYRKLFNQLSKSTVYSGQITVLIESLPPQHAELEKIAQLSEFKLVKSQDFIQVFENF